MSSRHEPCALGRRAKASERRLGAPGTDEAWLRHLLDVCHQTLEHLRTTGDLEVESLIIDLERVRATVQRQLKGLIPAYGRGF